jgi:hypothetical protein
MLEEVGVQDAVEEKIGIGPAKRWMSSNDIVSHSQEGSNPRPLALENLKEHSLIASR